ncbi:ABC transporter related [Parvibaculum lavamentivorans DS-1]|uniref:ABC transporter related n=1 Tax=Parvibaculum lavamentivorans (strain DS-1 / DSM 13023 / NCIMB 13966) TaxID=402881 RepID=A7HUC1_PARL1|nr:ABC transporter ATP-binding protein [Parvibaculum lavamentivorans]ABS63504.1 ABC transporter related [Parvibaculum lavamentivorans DS-1]
MTRVTVENLWKSYGDQTVLENINFVTEPGSFISLVGPSGCGKSTFLRMMLGDEAPSKGRILIDGVALEAEPSPDRGVVFQKYSVFPHLTALQNVMLGLEFAGSPIAGRLFGRARRQARAASLEMLQGVGLEQSANKYPSELSGGMQQRLAIAQALVKKPKIVLLDEPFGALDPGIRAEVHEIMLRLWREEGMTIFMVTHDLSEAFKLGTRVIAFDRRRTRPEELKAYGATVTFDLMVDGKIIPPRPETPAPLAAAAQ